MVCSRILGNKAAWQYEGESILCTLSRLHRISSLLLLYAIFRKDCLAEFKI